MSYPVFPVVTVIMGYGEKQRLYFHNSHSIAQKEIVMLAHVILCIPQKKVYFRFYEYT